MANDINRTPWLESLIERSADGLVHQAPRQGDAVKPGRQPKAYDKDEHAEIEICLTCPRKRCLLDDPKNEFCARLRREIKKRKGESKNVET